MLAYLFETISEHNHTLLQNHWVKGYYGWLLYNVFLMLYHKSKFDTDDNGYGWKEFAAFLKYHNISLIFSALMVVILVDQAVAIVALTSRLLKEFNYISADLQFREIYYYFVGPLIAGLQFILQKFKK